MITLNLASILCTRPRHVTASNYDDNWQGGKKKGKKSAPPRVIVTTRFIEAERLRCMCPRLGDAYARSEAVLDLRADVVYSRLRKVGERHRSGYNP